MKQRRLTRGISGIITVVLLIGVIAAALPTAAKETDGGTSSAVYYSTDENGYMMYKENNSDAPLAERDILLPGGSETLNGREGVKTVSESGEAEYSVTVPKSALRALHYISSAQGKRRGDRAFLKTGRHIAVYRGGQP